MDRMTSVRLLKAVGIEFPACRVDPPPRLSRGFGRPGWTADPRRRPSPFLQPSASAGEDAWDVEVRLPAAVGLVHDAWVPPESGMVVRGVAAGLVPGAVRLRLSATAARPGWWPVELRGTLGRCEAYVKVNGRARGRDPEP